MPPGKGTLRRPAGIAAITLGAIACAAAPASAYAANVPSTSGVLSPRLEELAKPAVSGAPAARQARELGLPREGPGSLLREGNRVLVEARFDEDDVAAGAEDLRSEGAEIVNVSRRYRTVTVAAKPDELAQLQGVRRLTSAREVLAPIAAESPCPSGAVVSEGEQQLHAGEAVGEARQVFGVDGSGVTVGILSDSFNRATESVEGGPIATKQAKDVETGDLPGAANTCSGQSTPVDVLDDSESEGEDEGRAMSQIVHDLAPGADLAFATAFTGEAAFAENIEKLAKPTGEGGAGASVIADDVAYFEEPFFQEGPVGVAVSKVTAEHGVSYFSAAGNDNLIEEPEPGVQNDIASWEAPAFRDAGSCPSAVAAFEVEVGFSLHAHHCMDFNPGAGTDTTFGITVSAGATLLDDLQWAEPWEGVNTDLDAFLIGPGGKVVAASWDDNIAEGRPFELIGWENEGGKAQVQLVINRYAGGSPRLKSALLENGGGVTTTEYPESRGGDIVGPTVFGHGGGEDVTSTGAIRYSTTTAPERYSSRGPVTHYFKPVTGGSTPAEALATPQVLSKPDLTATDCGATTFFAFEVGGKWRFCGTSAAAPHAAAVAALMLDKVPGAEPGEVHAALVESAAPIGASGPCAVGAGLVEAVGAVGLLINHESGTSPAACESPESGPWEEEIEEVEETVSPSTSPVAPVSSPNPPVEATTRSKSRPQASFRRHPGKIVRTRGRKAKVVFRFEANPLPATLLCDVDSGPFHPCPARFAHRFSLGWHTVRVKARDVAGSVGPTAAFRFRVKRVRPGGAGRRRVARRGHVHRSHRT
jgi:Subtilase family